MTHHHPVSNHHLLPKPLGERTSDTANTEEEDHIEGQTIYFNQDYKTEIQTKRKQVREEIKKLREKNVEAQSPTESVSGVRDKDILNMKGGCTHAETHGYSCGGGRGNYRDCWCRTAGPR